MLKEDIEKEGFVYQGDNYYKKGDYIVFLFPMHRILVKYFSNTVFHGVIKTYEDFKIVSSYFLASII